MYVCMCLVLSETRRECWIPGTVIIDSCKLLCWGWELSSGPLKEQLSLQPLLLALFFFPSLPELPICMDLSHRDSSGADNLSPPEVRAGHKHSQHQEEEEGQVPRQDKDLGPDSHSNVPSRPLKCHSREILHDHRLPIPANGYTN